MKITLRDKTYVAPVIMSRMVRKAYELLEVTKNPSGRVDELDMFVDYIVDLYGRQFSADEFYDGVPAADLYTTITEHLFEITNTTNNKLNQFPNAQPGK
jgi:hypothetical protein